MNICPAPKFEGIIRISPIPRSIGSDRPEFINWLLSKYNISTFGLWGRRPSMVSRKPMGLQPQFIDNSIRHSLVVENTYKLYANISLRLATSLYSMLERASGIYQRGSLPESDSTLFPVNLALIPSDRRLTLDLAAGDSRSHRTKTFPVFSFLVPGQKMHKKFPKDSLDLIRAVVKVKRFARYLNELAFVASLFRPSVLAKMFMKGLLSGKDSLNSRFSRKFGHSYPERFFKIFPTTDLSDLFGLPWLTAKLHLSDAAVYQSKTIFDTDFAPLFAGFLKTTPGQIGMSRAGRSFRRLMGSGKYLAESTSVAMPATVFFQFHNSLQRQTSARRKKDRIAAFGMHKSLNKIAYKRPTSLSKWAMRETDPDFPAPGYDSMLFSQRNFPVSGFRNISRWNKGDKWQHDLLTKSGEEKASDKPVFGKHAALLKKGMLVSRPASKTLNLDPRIFLHKTFLISQNGRTLPLFRGAEEAPKKMFINSKFRNYAVSDSPAWQHYSSGYNRPDMVPKQTVTTTRKKDVNRHISSHDKIFPLAETSYLSSGAPHIFSYPPDMKLATPGATTSQEISDEIKKIKAQTEILQQQESPPVPEVDINQLTNRVYDEIERKIRVERERRGL